MVKFTLNVEFNLSEHNLVELLWCYIPQNVKKKAKRGGKGVGFMHRMSSKSLFMMNCQRMLSQTRNTFFLLNYPFCITPPDPVI